MRSRAGGLTEAAERTEFTNGGTEKTETKRRRHWLSTFSFNPGAGLRPASRPSRCSKPSGRLRFAFVDSVAPFVNVTVSSGSSVL